MPSAIKIEEVHFHSLVEACSIFKILTLKEKRDQFGKVVRRKARLVARGFEGKRQADEQNYGPVARLTTVRVVISIALHHGWHMEQSDVKSAFLNGHLENPIYMGPPPGFEEKDGAVWKVEKAIYGLPGESFSEKYWLYHRNLGFTKVFLKRVSPRASACTFTVGKIAQQ